MQKKLHFTPYSTPEEVVLMQQMIFDKYGTVPDNPFDREALMYYEFAPPSSPAVHYSNAHHALSGGGEVTDKHKKWHRGKDIAENLKASLKGAPEKAMAV